MPGLNHMLLEMVISELKKSLKQNLGTHCFQPLKTNTVERWKYDEQACSITLEDAFWLQKMSESNSLGFFVCYTDYGHQS